MRILAADVGGTNTRVALYDGADVDIRRYESASFPGIAPILTAFLRGRTVDAAVIAVAGPVVAGACKTTNLPWNLDSFEIGKETGIARIGIVNDFEAIALGVGELPQSSLAVLQARPVDPEAPSAVLGAGTGLGEAIMVPTGGLLPKVLPTEGGHCSLAPRDATEVALLQFLLARHGHVSYERVLSGPGIEAIYDFLVKDGGGAELSGDDRAACISERALAGSDPACARAIEIFLSFYGAEAGNLALKTLPFGGLFIAGGIAPKILPLIQRGGFMSAFRAKGRMQPILDRVRVSVVLDDGVGLLGARRLAAALV